MLTHLGSFIGRLGPYGMPVVAIIIATVQQAYCYGHCIELDDELDRGGLH